MSAALLPTDGQASEVEQLRAELVRQQRNLRLLREIARLSRGGVDPQTIFEAIYGSLREVLPIDAFFVALAERADSPEYHFALFIDEGRPVPADDSRVGGLTGWILNLKESRLYHDLHADLDPDAPVPARFGNIARLSRSWIGVPLMVGRESVGVISVQGYEPGLYTESDLQLVEALADLAAVAIDNALLYQAEEDLSQSLATRVAARTEELAVLITIAAGLSRGRYDESRLTEAIERILWLLNLHTGVIWLADPSLGLRRAAAYAADGPVMLSDFVLDPESIAPDQVTIQVFQQNRSIMSPSLRMPRLRPQAELGLLVEETDEEDVSVFALPLQAHSRVVGVLTLYGVPGRELAEQDETLLAAIAQQLAIGIENARLYRDARATAAIAERRAENLALVHRISRLVSSSLDPGEVVRITVEQMAQLFGVDHCGIMLFDESGERGEVVAEFPPIGTIGVRAHFLPGDYLEAEPGRGEPGYVRNMQTDPRVRALREAAQGFGVRAMGLVPLISRGRSVGAISLNQIHTIREFSVEELELCRTIAAQVAIALENARLYQMSVTHVEQELEIARSIQANLFPRALPPIPGAALAGRCMPAFETGGDFYDVLQVGPGRYGFSIGDVSGKSLPAAMLMAVARSIVRSEALDHVLPERVVTETNGLVVQDVPPDTFVSLCYAVYETTTGRLVMANAGHITPLLRRADGTVEWLPIVSNLPLGINSEIQYEASTARLSAGDSVLFLTDGLVEAFSPQGEMFGFDRLARLFAETGNHSPDQVVDLLLDTVCDWQGREHRNDDMTAIVLQVQ